MIPYERLAYFGVLFLLLLPTIVLGINGKRSLIYNNLVGVFLLLLLFFNTGYQLAWLVGYVILQSVVVKGYCLYRKGRNKGIVFYFL